MRRIHFVSVISLWAMLGMNCQGVIRDSTSKTCTLEEECGQNEICLEKKCVQVECKKDLDCNDPQLKCGDYQCIETNYCEDDSPCKPPLPICDLNTHTCSACLPTCEGRCCGVDGCSRPCADQCPSTGQQCNATSCRCEGTCTPNCDVKQCGPFNCGTDCPNKCTGIQVCNRTTGLCECTPQCTNKCCGASGCPGVECSVDCKANGQTCNQVSCECESSCVPSCEGRECGPNSCNTGDCPNQCTGNQTCDTTTGKCICLPQCGGKCCGSDGCPQGGECGDYCADTGQTCNQETCQCEGEIVFKSWYMAGANPQRTSWVGEQVPTEAQLATPCGSNNPPGCGRNGKLYPLWSKPIEPYIPNRVQIVAGNNMIFLATARGLYAFDAETGADKWVYATEMPLGHSPTYYDTSISSQPRRLYVGGLDHKIHCMDADTGDPIWTVEARIDGIGGGFETSPLVLSISGTIYIYAGNRDGTMYAIKDDGLAGSLLWSYKTDGPILFSAAASKPTNGVYDETTRIYFASNDSYAYALNSLDGSLLWKSAKLPGQGFSAYWPVVYTDSSSQKEYVLLPGASNYRANVLPGTPGYAYNPSTQTWELTVVARNLQNLDREIWQGDLYTGDTSLSPCPTGTLIGVRQSNGLIDTSVENPGMAFSISGYYTTKPQRRTLFVLEAENGNEFTPYAPFLWQGTGGANRFPSLIMPDNNVYQAAGLLYRGADAGLNINIAGILSWKPGSHFVGTPESTSLIVDEPVYYSGGGNIVYLDWHTDLEVDAFDTSRANANYGTIDGSREWVYQSQNWVNNQPPLENIFPGYQAAMDAVGGDSGTGKWYAINHGAFGPNGSYGRDGHGNPPIPYQGKVYLHKGNAILAFGPEVRATGTKLETARTSTTNVVSFHPSVSLDTLKQRLSDEIQKMIDADHLRPGYYSSGNVNETNAQMCGADFLDYFHNPGDTLWVLSSAMQYLPSSLQTQLVGYLQSEYSSYNPASVSHIGWKSGGQREWYSLPPEVDADRANFGPTSWSGNYEFGGWSQKDGNTNIPPYNFYALFRYAVALNMSPSETLALFDATKDGLSKNVPSDTFLAQFPFVHNAYLTGYYGYLQLQQRALLTPDSSISSAYQSLLTKRMSTYTLSAPSSYPDDTCSAFNISRNFMFLAPEVMDDLMNLPASTFQSNVQATLDDYSKEASYWFVHGFDETVNEGAHQPMYDTLLLQAKAYILKQSPEELLKYLDVPGFKIGDLFYIQNLIAVIEAAEAAQTISRRKCESNSWDEKK